MRTSIKLGIKLENRLTDEEIAKVLESYRAGELGLANKIVMHYLGLALAIACRFGFNFPNKKYEIASEALFLLVKVVQLIQKQETIENTSGYVSKYISLGLRKFLKEDTLIRIPVKSASRKKLAPPVKETSAEPCAKVEHSFNEIISSLNLTILQKEILKLRLENYTDREIGDKLGCSHTTVRIQRNLIGEKYDALMLS